MAPAIEVRTPGGETIYRWADAMPPALVWLPPSEWRSGDTITVTSLPEYLPATWGLTVERTPGLAWPLGLVWSSEHEDIHNDTMALVHAYARSDAG